MNRVHRFTFYYRQGCHLCDEMWQLLLELQTERPFELERVDVDSSADLKNRYGLKIPVLELQGEEICHYYLDRQSVIERLQCNV